MQTAVIEEKRSEHPHPWETMIRRAYGETASLNFSIEDDVGRKGAYQKFHFEGPPPPSSVARKLLTGLFEFPKMPGCTGEGAARLVMDGQEFSFDLVAQSSGHVEEARSREEGVALTIWTTSDDRD